MNMKIFAIFFLLFSGSWAAMASSMPSWPIRVSEVRLYDDGGTVAYITTDSNNRYFIFCIDRRLMTSTYNAFYLYATHPNEKQAKLLKISSRAEKEFARQIKLSLDTYIGISKEKEIIENLKKKAPGRSELEIGLAVLLSKIEEIH